MLKANAFKSASEASENNKATIILVSVATDSREQQRQLTVEVCGLACPGYSIMLDWDK